MGKKKSNNKHSFVDTDSSLKKLVSYLVDPNIQSWLWDSSRGIRERILTMNYDVLRRVVDQVPLINAIINARIDQILPFTKFATEEGQQGFTFEIENQTKEFRGAEKDENEIYELTTFIEQTGFFYDPDREDDFVDYVSMFVRDIYEIDQIATEIQYNRRGEPVAFWLLDGTTIRRVSDEDRFKRGIRYVQVVDDKIVEEYTPERLLFDYKYKRSSIKYRGYGYSPVEMAVNVITTLLFGYHYVRDQLVKDRVPKGFLSVMGDVSKPQLDAIRNYWYAAMTGAGASWNIPILPSGKDGVGIEFKTLSHSNRDMEFHKTLMFVSSIIAAVFGIDLAELGIKSDDSQSLIGESMEPRIRHSKNRGLGSMLAFIEQHVNKIIRKVTRKYRFKFVGLEVEDEQKKVDIRSKQLTGWRSVDEIREEEGLDPFDEEWSKIPLNPQLIQLYMQLKGQEMMQQQGQNPFGGMEGGEESEEEQPEEEQEEGQEENYFSFGKSLTNIKRKPVKTWYIKVH